MRNTRGSTRLRSAKTAPPYPNITLLTRITFLCPALTQCEGQSTFDQGLSRPGFVALPVTGLLPFLVRGVNALCHVNNTLSIGLNGLSTLGRWYIAVNVLGFVYSVFSLFWNSGQPIR